jgi:two-component system, NarL family, nitrate/nitrite response regulator NarL
MNTRILVADDAKMIRRAIRRVVEAQEDFVVCAEAADGADAVSKAVESRPDVVVMDIRMPVMNGIDAAKILAEKCPNTVVIADSVHVQSEYFAELKRIGVKGFVPKDRIVPDLVAAIGEVLRGGTWFRNASPRTA